MFSSSMCLLRGGGPWRADAPSFFRYPSFGLFACAQAVPVPMEGAFAGRTLGAEFFLTRGCRRNEAHALKAFVDERAQLGVHKDPRRRWALQVTAAPAFGG